MRLLWGLATILCLTGGAVMAQDQAQTPAADNSVASTSSASGPRTGKLIFPVLVFDRARVLSKCQAGSALEVRIEKARAALLAENDKIYADLESEEKQIADIRDSLSEADFKARAQAFDSKVTEVRAAQDAKGKKLQSLYDSGLSQIEKDMNEVLTGIARDYGAVVMFERGQVYLMSGAIDVSGIAIDRLDARTAAAQSSDATVPDVTVPDAQVTQTSPAPDATSE